MENKPIQLLYSFRLKWRDLMALEEIERAALVGVFFCENEVNCLRRLARISMFWEPENARINEAATIQRSMLLRALTGKLFEFLALYNEISSKGRESQALRRVFGSLKEKHRACRNHRGFKIADKIRNSQAHHYGLSQIIELCSKHNPEANCDMYFTPESGSSFIPFAEHLAFNPDPSGRLEEELTEREIKEIVDDWIDWTNDCTDLVRDFRERLFDELIVPIKPGIRAQTRVEYLDPDLKVSDEFRLPLFLQVSR